MMELDLINWEEFENGIGVITLTNSPGNLMNRQFFEELRWVVKKKVEFSRINSLIIHGEGRHFSAGADLNNLLLNIHKENENQGKAYSNVPDFLLENLDTFKTLETLKMPVVSVIKGVCVGSALELAMFCNYRICGNGALLGLPEVSFELMPGIGGIHNMINLIGYAKAIEVCLTGDNLTAEDALKLGLVDQIVSRKNIFEYTFSLLRSFDSRFTREAFKKHSTEFNYEYWQEQHNN